MEPTRGYWDRVWKEFGIGFPALVTLQALGVIAANTTGYDFLGMSLAFQKVLQATRGVMMVTDIQVFLPNLGSGASAGNNTFILNRTDVNGNILATVGTLVVPYTSSYLALDLRASPGGGKQVQGIPLQMTDYLRLDTGTLATGLTTAPSNPRMRVYMQIAPING